jgi:hypothetical protein
MCVIELAMNTQIAAAPIESQSKGILLSQRVW